MQRLTLHQTCDSVRSASCVSGGGGCAACGPPRPLLELSVVPPCFNIIFCWSCFLLFSNQLSTVALASNLCHVLSFLDSFQVLSGKLFYHKSYSTVDGQAGYWASLLCFLPSTGIWCCWAVEQLPQKWTEQAFSLSLAPFLLIPTLG